MRKKRNRPFSLIELMITLAIIGIATSFLALKGYSLLQKARFSIVVKEITNTLKEMRGLALMQDKDRIFSLKNEGMGLILITGIEGERLFTKRYEGFFCTCDGQKRNVYLRFSSRGSIAPLCEIEIKYFKENYKIDLKKFFSISLAGKE